MTSVVLVTEDRTGGGLEKVIRAEVQGRRTEPLRFFPGRPVNGNGDLLKRVARAQDALNSQNRPDHIFFIMDVRRSWEVLDLPKPLPPHSAASLQAFIGLATQAMRARACRGSDALLWNSIQPRIHCHLLIWERESIILPVADALDFGPPEIDVCACTSAFEWVQERAKARGRTHSKALGTMNCLLSVAENRELRARAVAANPSLEAIVQAVVAL